MKHRLNMDKIAKGLGAKRGGKLRAGAGYFGAMELVAEVRERLRAPEGGGRATDPTWTERRLLPLKPATLDRLGTIAAKVSQKTGRTVQPLQLAAILVEQATDRLSDEELDALVEQAVRRAG